MADDEAKSAANTHGPTPELAASLRARMQKCFGAALMADTDWVHRDPDFDALESDYYEIWRQKSGGHKKYSYFSLYDRLFAQYRGRAPRMLEIGVYRGASVLSWQEFLGDGATVVGVDVNPDCKQWDDPSGDRHIRIGNQADEAFLYDVANEFGPFDIVLDDGSHKTTDQISSFNTLFADHMAFGGTYFIEDTNTSCWPSYQSGDVDIFDLVEAGAIATHLFYAEHGYADYARASHPRPFRTAAAAKLIEEIRIFDSAVAFIKAREDYHPPLVDHRK